MVLNGFRGGGGGRGGVSENRHCPSTFHNGSGYDFKHSIRKLYKIDRNLEIISKTEVYFSIVVKVRETNITFEFKDSLKFLLKSIDKSAAVLYINNVVNNFKNLVSLFKEKYPDIMDEILELLVQKCFSLFIP